MMGEVFEVVSRMGMGSMDKGYMREAGYYAHYSTLVGGLGSMTNGWDSHVGHNLNMPNLLPVLL